VSRSLLRSDIEKKEHKSMSEKKARLQNWLLVFMVALISTLYIFSLFFEISFLTSILQFSFSLSTLYLISLLIQRKILLVYGEEVEVSGQKYFKK